MCGIAGLIDPALGAPELEATIRSMTATLFHRGPDAGGIRLDSGMALGHRRLSIMDLSPAGAQPMMLGEGGPTIAFNGEIYNFADLKRELVLAGRSFRGHSDTEVVLHAYDEWGMEGLKRLEGIFAVALWDPAERRLILMRDRLGVKPLFYAKSGNRLVFGSEIKALLAAGGIDTAIDEQALSEYLWYGNAYEDRTIYRGIRSLPPGGWLIAENGRFRTEPWWLLEEWLQARAVPGNEREAATAVREALDAAVKRQLVADVPVGIFLSGGIDSSGIAAAAMHVQDQPLRSYSVGFDFDHGADELPKARMVAGMLGLDHHEVRVGGSDLEDVLPALARSHDEPFGDAANIPLYLLAKRLEGTIKVVLQGDGGDEMFAGYRRYAMLRNSAYWRCWPDFLSPAVRMVFGGAGARFSRMVGALGSRDPAMRMALLLTTETLTDPPSGLLKKEVGERLATATDPFLAYRRCAKRFDGTDPVRQMLLTDTVLELPSRFLAKVDRATMASGLEARVPYLDENVARLAVSLPADWKAKGAQKKVVLRNALRQRVPDAVLDGPKTGFGVPYRHWLRTSLFDFARGAVLDPGFLNRFGFEGRALESAFSEHRRGARDRGESLWKVFQLALWARECAPMSGLGGR